MAKDSIVSFSNSMFSLYCLHCIAVVLHFISLKLFSLFPLIRDYQLLYLLFRSNQMLSDCKRHSTLLFMFHLV